MLRIPVLAILTALALPTAANASVIPSVSGDTLTVIGDGAADSITVRAPSDTTIDVNGFDFNRATFSKIAIRSGGGAASGSKQRSASSSVAPPHSSSKSSSCFDF